MFEVFARYDLIDDDKARPTYADLARHARHHDHDRHQSSGRHAQADGSRQIVSIAFAISRRVTKVREGERNKAQLLFRGDDRELDFRFHRSIDCAKPRHGPNWTSATPSTASRGKAVWAGLSGARPGAEA